MESIKIKPRALPRDFGDLLLYLVGTSVPTVVILSPTILTYLILRVDALWNLVLWSTLLLGFSFFNFSMSMNKKGIKFHRLFGSPRFLEWKDIEEIKSVKPSEVILKGWFTIHYFQREACLGFTVKQRYKIKWKNGYCYYAPSNKNKFISTIKKFKKNAKIN